MPLFQILHYTAVYYTEESVVTATNLHSIIDVKATRSVFIS